MVCSVDDRKQSKGTTVRRRVIQGDYRAPIGKKFVHKPTVSCGCAFSSSKIYGMAL